MTLIYCEKGEINFYVKVLHEREPEARIHISLAPQVFGEPLGVIETKVMSDSKNIIVEGGVVPASNDLRNWLEA